MRHEDVRQFGLDTEDPDIRMLQRARAFMAENGWCQKVPLHHGGAVCLLAAIRHGNNLSCYSGLSGSPDIRRLSLAMGFCSPSEAFLWNDHLCKTQEEALARLDLGIQNIRARART